MGIACPGLTGMLDIRLAQFNLAQGIYEFDSNMTL